MSQNKRAIDAASAHEPNTRISSDTKSAVKALKTMTDEEDAAITADALADPDNLPADDLFARQPATFLGRPKSKNPKQPVSIRLDADVIKYYKSAGSGWQSRINEALRKAAKLPKVGK